MTKEEILQINFEEQELLFHKELLALSRNPFIDNGNLEESLKVITKATAKALHVPRASIWFYNADQTSIVCHDLFETATSTHSEGLELKAQDFPAYFNYLLEERTLPADDAQTDPATFEFTTSYLRPLNIISMLDAPIRVNGKMVGVVCCEQVGTKRSWSYSEQIFIGNITDIIARAIQAKERLIAQTELKHLNSQLENLVQEKTELLEEQRARSVFASKMALLGEMAGSIAHEINNPLAIILSSLGQIKKLDQKGQLTTDTVKEIFNDIESTTLRIEKVVKGLRFFARDANLDAFKVTPINQIIEDTFSLCQEKFQTHGCKLEAHLPSEELHINCQAVSISQALLNLISNSYDAISEDSTSGWIRVEVKDEGKMIGIYVSDSGKGVPQIIKEKIMLPFFTTKPIGKGTGLGLSIVKGITEQHQGEFFLDENSPQTCFVMRLSKA